jgi:tripartite-type tricarboxylate transporter receptor subunit TctC
MQSPRREFLCLAASAAALPALPRAARAEAYPSRPVHIIVSFPAGTAPDITGRIVAQALSERLGQQIVVDNRPGASGSIAIETAAKAPADGYTLLLALSSNVVNAALYTNLGFNVVRDITPVAFVGANPFVLVATPSLPVKTFPEFIAYAKANPGKVNMASQGVGTTPHVCGELLKLMTGITFTHVPYRTALMPDLLAGQVHFYFSPLPQPIEYVKDGRLRGLAITSAARSALLPEVPTVGEFVPGYQAVGWVGVGTPRGTSSDVIDKLNNELNVLVSEPQMQARLLSLGVESKPMNPAEFGKFIGEEYDKWADVIRRADVKPE